MMIIKIAAFCIYLIRKRRKKRISLQRRFNSNEKRDLHTGGNSELDVVWLLLQLLLEIKCMKNKNRGPNIY